MKTLADLNIMDIGHTVQITGMVLSGPDGNHVVKFPGEIDGAPSQPYELMEFSVEDWERFLYQSDFLEVELTGPVKAVVRKSQRQIDVAISWAVFKRDRYRCRYCGKDGPLTVDHIVTWESGGPSIQANLLASCKKCNRIRGNREYLDWLQSQDYRHVSKRGISDDTRYLNEQVLTAIPYLESLRVDHQRSR